MSVFWILAVCLMLLALGLLLPSLLRTKRNAVTSAVTGATDLVIKRSVGDASDAGRANLAILQEQLTQLDAELAAGSITDAQHAQTKAEIERRALEETAGIEQTIVRPAAGQPIAAPRATRTAVLVSLGIPLLALGIYGFLGNPQGFMDPKDAVAPGGEVTQAQVEAMVAQLAQRLENAPADKPADPKGWEMLARTYAAMQRFAEADKAYARATALAPDNAQLLADHADVMAMLQGQSALGAPEKLIESALKLDPKNVKALALAGSIAFERKDFSTATTYWTQARQLAPAGSEFAKGLDSSLEAARTAPAATEIQATQGNAQKAVVSAATTVPASQASTSAPAAATATALTAPSNITGVVSLSPALAAKVAPEDTVFIFARAADGPRMPLAILRHKASDLPVRFTLDDSTAMSPEMKLSKFAQVIVGARISKSGNATPQPGDLMGQAGPLKPPVAQLDLLINSVQP